MLVKQAEEIIPLLPSKVVLDTQLTEKYIILMLFQSAIQESMRHKWNWLTSPERRLLTTTITITARSPPLFASEAEKKRFLMSPLSHKCE